MKIDILTVKEREDGTKEIIFDYDDEFLKYVKLKTGKKIPSKKDINNVFLECLEDGLQLLEKERKEDE
jgi:hypothetical protein